VDLRLVEYLTYLGLGLGLTLFVGQVLYRSGAFLADALGNLTLADSINRLLIVGFSLIGLGVAALLLQVDGRLTSAADVVKMVVIRTGLLLLVLGGLHLANLAVLRRLRRPTEAAGESIGGGRSQVRASGRFPY
jgi:hypothetical protein